MNTKYCPHISRFYHPAIVLALALSGHIAFAAATATDTASNYGSSWSTSPPNSGSGFGSWTVIVNNNDGPPYVGTYIAQSSSYGDTINDAGGNAWATYANSGNGSGSISISRAFTAGPSTSASLYNQTFSYDLSSGGVGPGQGLLSTEIGNAFSLQYVGTGNVDSLTLNTPTSSLNTGVGYGALNSGLAVSLAVSGALNSPSEDYTLTISPFSGGSPLYQTSGTFDSSSYNTSSFTFLDSDTTGNAYFNELNITAEAVPEPSTFVLIGAGVAGLWGLRRRTA